MVEEKFSENVVVDTTSTIHLQVFTIKTAKIKGESCSAAAPQTQNQLFSLLMFCHQEPHFVVCPV